MYDTYDVCVQYYMKVCIVPNVHIQSIVIKLSNLNCECLDTVLISVQTGLDLHENPGVIQMGTCHMSIWDQGHTVIM